MQIKLKTLENYFYLDRVFVYDEKKKLVYLLILVKILKKFILILEIQKDMEAIQEN